MIEDSFSLSLKAKLETLFSTYASNLKIPEQLEIISNGFVFSKVNSSANILVMGINPSLRNDFVSQDGYSYDYTTLASDRYFKKFPPLLKEVEHFGITYCDLFYHRHTEQKQIDHFLKDDLGRAFLKEQLHLTRQVIQYVSPRLIVLFNRKGGEFFTQDWIGLTLEEYTSISPKSSIPNLFKIKDTHSSIYFSTFLGYRTSKLTYLQLLKDLPSLFTILTDI